MSQNDVPRLRATREAQRTDASDGPVLGDLPPEERLRADFYDFLSGLLSSPPSEPRLRELAQLSGDATPIGETISALAAVSARLDPHAVEREHHALFIGLGRGEVLPYASYYLTGFLNEKPLAKLRGDMRALRMKRTPGRFDSEDNVASLFEMMGGLIRGRFGAEVDLETQRTFFNTHIGCWAHHFFTDLEAAKASVFYAPVGALGRLFVEIEREAFRLETTRA